jgi:hypothetical protein
MKQTEMLGDSNSMSSSTNAHYFASAEVNHNILHRFAKYHFVSCQRSRMRFFPLQPEDRLLCLSLSQTISAASR